MQNQMPPVPGMSSFKSNISSDESVAGSDSFVSPSAKASVSKDAEADVDLDIPSHEEENPKPQYFSPDDNLASQVKLPQAPKKGIDVVATAKGFYNQMRIKEGERFTIKSFEDIGEWMTCIDPSFEKKRREFLKAKKAR